VTASLPAGELFIVQPDGGMTPLGVAGPFELHHEWPAAPHQWPPAGLDVIREGRLEPRS
jgi:hypothetical protein